MHGHYFFPDLFRKYLYHCQEIIRIIGDKFRSQLDFILFETDPHKSASVGQRIQLSGSEASEKLYHLIQINTPATDCRFYTENDKKIKALFPKYYTTSMSYSLRLWKGLD